MSLSAYLSLVVICALGAISPGPSLAVVLRNTLYGGRRYGVLTGLSHGAGVGLYALATALGLATLITTHAGIFEGLTLAGSAYLLWLGASALRGQGALKATANPLSTPATPSPHIRAIDALRDGFTIALLNPKIGLFFLALFSQLVQPLSGIWTVALLAGTASGIDALWYITVAAALSATGATAWLRRHGLWIERLTGALLVFLALSTAINAITTPAASFH
ncbi:MAG: LysE family translocator [Spiribacter sp.]|jgi:threonine/homoserine/homoserine lactone efflux protein|nr:LysE family translocator [Spiribacter sp.]MDR9489955.1 LysE family translocator [Spiribacter sp.]